MNKVQVYESILKKFGEEATKEFLATGELPAVKLSPKEMKVLKAGGKSFVGGELRFSDEADILEASTNLYGSDVTNFYSK